MTTTRERILRALEAGPTYAPFLALIVDRDDFAHEIAALLDEGKIRRARQRPNRAYELARPGS